MARSQIRKKAIQAINDRGCLLVFPINNRKDPASLWYELHPRTKMRWEWDEGGDNRVSDLWFLREELSRSREVVYSKWYQNRATLMSKDVFVDLLVFLKSRTVGENLQGESRSALEFLISDSPLSTKQLKAALELEGRLLEPTYNRAMKTLWRHLLIVAFGEFEDSSFPSLGIGATETLFEELWQESLTRNAEDAGNRLEKRLGKANLFLKFAVKVQADAKRFESP